MDPKEKKRLRAQAQRLDATVHISSPELRESLLTEIIRQLKKRRLIKIKLLKSVAEKGAREELAERIASQAGAVLVEVKGNTVVLFKEKKEA